MRACTYRSALETMHARTCYACMSMDMQCMPACIHPSPCVRVQALMSFRVTVCGRRGRWWPFPHSLYLSLTHTPLLSTQRGGATHACVRMRRRWAHPPVRPCIRMRVQCRRLVRTRCPGWNIQPDVRVPRAARTQRRGRGRGRGGG